MTDRDDGGDGGADSLRRTRRQKSDILTEQSLYRLLDNCHRADGKPRRSVTDDIWLGESTKLGHDLRGVVVLVVVVVRGGGGGGLSCHSGIQAPLKEDGSIVHFPQFIYYHAFIDNDKVGFLINHFLI